MELNISSEYNRIYGKPYITVDKLHLEPDSDYIVEIKCLMKNYPYTLCPVLKAIEPKAYFLPNRPAVSLAGKKNKKVKMIALILESGEKETLLVHTDSGDLEIAFQCEFYDEINHIKTREMGRVSSRTLMTRSNVSENKLQYICRVKEELKEDNLMFSIEWTKNL